MWSKKDAGAGGRRIHRSSGSHTRLPGLCFASANAGKQGPAIFIISQNYQASNFFCVFRQENNQGD
jgi:hypothetical protein